MYSSYNCLENNAKYKLAHAYVPYQVMDKVRCLDEALKKGSLFPELHLPYYIRDSRDNKKKC
ncbi:MAG: spore coat associated protein CotJA [Clostridiales bacterium]|nr:spore coat associated protein CotJA [Clostridiales bacterium]